MNIATATRAVLPPVVAFCSRRRLLTIFLAAMLSALSVFATSRYLGVTTDTGGMFAASLPWKRSSDALAADFPQNDSLLVAVVDARIPEEAEATAAALAAKLLANPKMFPHVDQPDASPYLLKNAFLLVDTPTLTDLLNRTVDAQPFLGQLAADPSLRGLFGALGLIAEGARRGLGNEAALAPALNSFHAALAAAASGHPAPLSWESLLAGKLADQAGKFRFVLAKPTLDFGALQPGGLASDAIRQAASGLPYVKSGEAHVRLTGSVALDDEEFATVAEGAAIGLAGSFVLVVLWLYLAVRSWRLIVPILATLVLGLLLTTGFAAITVGMLNLISVAFAILFVGIAVDFSIQFSVRLRERRFTYPDMTDALRETGRRAGAQILVAALATAAGFLAFTPTDFVGVAQLGIIAGGGMLIAFACTLTFLPAMLCLCHPKREQREVAVRWMRALDPVLIHRRWSVVALFSVLALSGAALTAFIRFDGDPLHTKNQHTEAVRTLHDLMTDPLTNPYTIEAVLPSLKDAAQVTPGLAKLELVDSVLSLQSFVPGDQPAKLALIADAAGLLAPSLAPPTDPPAPSAATLRQAGATLSASLHEALPKLAPDDRLRDIAADLDRLLATSDTNLLATSEALTRFLPAQLERLRLALAAGPVTLGDIPADLERDWLLPDGRARIQVLPKAAVHNGRKLSQFVDTVDNLLPSATGSAVWIVKSAQTIIGAFRIAAVSALLAIAVILALALRRTLDVALVMAPLLVSAMLTVVLLEAFRMKLNFANIIALPLLLGVGVSFNIYFVMNWRAGVTRFLGSATARAVMFSALTTGTAFGSLALSNHPGTASMGKLLLISLGCTVVTSLVFLPALLSLAPRPHVALGGRE